MKKYASTLFAAAISVIAAIGIAVLVLRTRNTATVAPKETTVEKNVVKTKHMKKISVPARAKPAEASPPKATKPESVRPDGARTSAGENAVEMPKEVDIDAGKKADDDNPFPRYLDMFKNDPAGLAAEFQKEAEADRSKQQKMREQAIAMLELNAEQATFFEKVLDDIRNAVFLLEQENVGLITSGQLNMDTAAEGRLWNSNTLLADQTLAAREKIVQDAAVELYNQLDIDSIPDARKQAIIKRVAYITSFSLDCYEPVLQVYDKVYRCMSIGNGIFSWGKRQSQKK